MDVPFLYYKIIEEDTSFESLERLNVPIPDGDDNNPYFDLRDYSLGIEVLVGRESFPLLIEKEKINKNL